MVFYGTKTMGDQHGGGREFWHTQMVYGVRHLMKKNAKEKHLDIFGKIILNSVYDI